MDLKNECLQVYNTVCRSSSTASECVNRISKGQTRSLNDLANVLPPQEHVELALILAYATVTLYGVNLRCSGTDEKRHPLNREYERLLTYVAKIRSSIDRPRKRKLEVTLSRQDPE